MHARAGDDLRLALSRAEFSGSDLRADLRLRVFRAATGWMIRVVAPGLGLSSTAPLGRWLSGAALLQCRSRRTMFRLGPDTVRMSEATVALSPELTVAFRAPGKLTIDGATACRADGLSLKPQAAAGVGRSLFKRRLNGAITEFRLDNARLIDPDLVLGQVAAGRAWAFRPETILSLGGETFVDGGDAAAIVLLDAEGVLRHRDGSPERYQPSLRLQRASIALVNDRGPRRRSAVVGLVAPHTLRVGRATVRFVGSADETIYLRLGHRGRSEIATDLLVDRLTVPMPGSSAVASADALVTKVVFQGQPPTTSPTALAAVASKAHAMIWLGEGAPFLVVANTAPLELHVKRGFDQVDLKFRLKNFQILVSPNTGSAYLQRAAEVNANDPFKYTYGDIAVRVEFPPQHVAETYTPFQDPTACGVPPDGWPSISKAELSKPSWLHFSHHADPDDQDPPWARQPLTIESMTDWSGLHLDTHPRALPAGATVPDQLAWLNPGSTDTFDQVMAKVAKGLTKPTDDQTSLEMTSRLFLSPSAGSQWLTNKKPLAKPDPQDADATIDPSGWVPLWHARLDGRDGNSVRAIWSDYLQEQTFGTLLSDPESNDLSGISFGDQWELILQQSVYGLPGLAKIKPPLPAPAPPNSPNPVQPPASQNSNASDSDTAAVVVRPQPLPGYLSNPPGLKLYVAPGNVVATREEIGIAGATPFEQASVVLTAWGGSLTADWQSDPPYLLWDKPGGPPPHSKQQWPRTPSLELVKYYSQLGRDIRIETVHKGYLLPLGIRASYVKLIERRFFRDPKDPKKGVIAYLISHQFIAIRRPDKVYPALGQPFAGRLFPASNLTMLTLRTPDLINPLAGTTVTAPAPSPKPSAVADPKSGQIVFTGMVDGQLAFWPRLAQGTPGSDAGYFDFKWALDGDATPIVSKLIFVDQSVIPTTGLGLIAEYYESLPTDSPLRRADHHGARRKYALSKQEGDTSFDTDHWSLGVDGRIGQGQSKPESFAIDGSLAGADQPPFYPAIRQATISAQTVDHLIGRPQGLIDVAFPTFYRNGGFGVSCNKSDIFLEVIRPQIKLNADDHGPATGGVAKPNAYVAAFSRQSGLVGGQPGTEPAAACSGSPSAGFDYSDAANGDFKPAKFFGGAKLLGILDLGALAAQAIGGFGSAAPQLLERVGYGVTDAQDEAGAVSGVQQVLGLAAASAEQALTALVTALGTPVLGSIKAADLYSNLFVSASGLRDSLNAADPQSDVALALAATNLAHLSGPTTSIMVKAKALAAEMDRIRRDPVPPAIGADVDALTAIWGHFGDLATDAVTGLGATLIARITAQITQLAQSLLTAGLADVFLGISDAAGAGAVIEDPALLTDPSNDDLFTATFASAIQTLLLDPRALSTLATGQIDYGPTRLRAAFLNAVRDCAETLRWQLQDPSANARNILNDAIQAQLSSDLTGAVGAVVTTYVAPGSFDQVKARLAQMSDGLARLDFSPVLDSYRDTLPARTGGSLFTTFKSQLVGRLGAAVQAAAAAQIQQATASLNELISSSRQALVQQMAARLQPILTGLGQEIAFVDLAAAGRAAKQWVHVEAGVIKAPMLAFADDVARNLSGDLTVLQADAQAVAANAAALTETTPSPAFSQAQARLASAAARLNATMGAFLAPTAGLKALRQRLDANDPTLDNLSDCLAAASKLISLRIQALGNTIDVSTQALAVARAVAPNDVANLPTLGAIVTRTADLVANLTGLAQIANAVGVGPAVSSALNTAASAINDQPYADAVNHVLPALAQQATTLLATAQGIAGLAATITTPAAAVACAQSFQQFASDASAFVTTVQKPLLALGLQTVAIPPGLADAISGQATQVLRDVATPLFTLYDQVNGLVPNIQPLFADPIVMAVLQGSSIDIAAAVVAFNSDYDDLKAITSTTSDQASRQAAQRIAARWVHPTDMGVWKLISCVTQLVESVLRGNFGNLINLKALFDNISPIVDSLLTALLPTRVDLSYDWTTQISPLAGIFQMVSSTPSDLTLKTNVTVDLVSGLRTAVAQGVLQPFEIKLLNGDIATVTFSQATFNSVDGASPTFDVRVSGVTFGPAVDFLKDLASWLSPSGKGFYLSLTSEPVGIEAGFTFDAGVVAVGGLEFINVSFGVSVQLPFGPGGASYTFRLASADRPFLISAPPYGGGGYLAITKPVNGGGGQLDVEFVFGAVVAIKFGPLNGQGRVVAGMHINNNEIEALVEAVGEGSIACFSICIYILVDLKQNRDTGNVEGQASYEVSFSVGFASISFGFTASYKVSGHGGGALAANASREPLALASADATTWDCSVPHRGPPSAVIINNTPQKGRSWQAHRARLAMDLLAS